MIKVTRYSLLILILFVISFTMLLDLLPPIEVDTLLYHLAIPKIWLRHGIFTEVPTIDNSYFPMNVNLLYLAPLAFGFDIGAKFIHNFFGILTALLIFLHLKKRLSVNWALLGSLIFLTIPRVFRLCASAYVDLGLAFFITAAVLGLVHWHDTGRRIFFILSATALGLALGTKYSSFLALVFLAMGVFWICNRSGIAFRKSCMWSLVYVCLAFALFFPWAVKNIIYTGNPFYPLLNQFLGLQPYSPERYSVSAFMYREYAYGETFWQTLLVPIRFFFEGKDFSLHYFGGILNPFLFLLPLLSLVKPESWENRSIAIFSAIWIVLVIFTSPHLLVRYIVPVLPLLSILSVFGLYKIWSWLGNYNKKLSMAVIFVLMITMLSYNAVMVYKFLQVIDPWPFLSGQETREDYLYRTEITYPATNYINHHTDKDAKILLFRAGDRGYYLDRDYLHCSPFSSMPILPVMDRATSWEDIASGLKEMGITHVMTNHQLLAKYLKTLPPEKLRIWIEFLTHGCRRVFQEKDFAVYELLK